MQRLAKGHPDRIGWLFTTCGTILSLVAASTWLITT